MAISICLIYCYISKEEMNILLQLKCPKVETSEETYGLHLISGVQEQRLCGFSIYRGKTGNRHNDVHSI